MPQYKIYVTVKSRKLFFTVQASSAKEAKERALDLITIDKIVPDTTTFNPIGSNPFDWFK